MKNKDFDNIDKLAQDAFEHFEVPISSGDWMDFQQQLDQEATIDSAAKEALAGYEVALDPNGWDEFEQLQQRKKAAPLYIWWCKAAEVGVMSLLLLGTIFYLPCSKKSTNSNSLAYGSITTLNSSSVVTNKATNNTFTTTAAAKLLQEGANTNAEDKLAITSNPSITEQETTTAQNNAATQQENSSSSTTATNMASIQQVQEASTTALSSITTKNNTTSPTTTTTTTVQTKPASNTTAALKATAPNEPRPTVERATITTAATTAVIEDNILNNSKKATADQELEAIQSQALQLLLPIDQDHTIEPITTIGSIELKAPYIRRQYLGAVLGVGANMGTSMGNSSIGYSGGLTYEKEFSSKISLSIGVLGNYKRYDRSDLILLDRSDLDGQIYEMTQVKTSNLVLVEIPLDIHYTFFRSDKWRIYATAGLSANAIFSRTYTGSQEVAINSLSISTDLNSDDFERGLAEGGAAPQNIYLSLGGGVGVERKLGDKLSLYLVPTYRHGINTVHGDLIHTFNVNIGIKKAL